MEKYLTIQEVCERIKFAPQTLYNYISKGKLEEGKHFIKPSRKKILFIWSQMEAWLKEQAERNKRPERISTDLQPPVESTVEKIIELSNIPIKPTYPKSAINI